MMKKFGKFLKLGDFQIILLLIFILIPINFLLFASRGEGAEFYGSTQYIQFVRLFPESLGDVRLEPAYIAITHFIWKITGLSLPTIFAATRYLVWAVQLVFIYLLFKLLTNQKLLSILGVLILNFSFAQFAIANNLFRNHTANLLVFIIIFLVVRFFKTPNLNFRKYLIVVGILLGLITYTHIFTSAVIFSTFLLFLIFLLILSFLKREFSLKDFPKPTFQLIAGSILVGLATSIPFIFRTLPFYWVLVASFLTGRGPWEIRTPTPQLNLDLFGSLANFFNQPAAGLVNSLRFFFEFKQISIPTIMIFLVFVTVVFIILKARTASSFFILSSWLMTYLGTKLEFFGVGVVPTRFATISFYPSILLLAFLATPVFEKIRNSLAKTGLAVIILTAFLAQNLPNIFENTILVNSTHQKLRDELTAEVLKEAKINIQPKTAVFSLNSGLPNLRNDLILGYPAEFFSTNESEKAAEIAKTYDVKFFLFDENIKALRSGVTGEWIYFDFGKFKDKNFFKKIAQKENSFANISLYQVQDSTKVTNEREPELDRFILENEAFQKLDREISSQKITSWQILVNLSEGAKTITEKIYFDEGKISLTYAAQNFVIIEKGKIKNRLTLNLPEIQARKSLPKIQLAIFVPSAVTNLPGPGLATEFAYLAEFSYDHYFTEFAVPPDELTGFNLQFLERDQYRLLIRSVTTLVGSLIFGILLFWNSYSERKFVFWKLAKNEQFLRFALAIFVILAILDSAFFTTFFTSFYKNLFQ